MSDRILIGAACVPVLCGLVLLILLARVPATALAPASAGAQPMAAAAHSSVKARSWVGVVVAANTAELAANMDGRVDRVFVRTGDTVAKGDRLVQFDAFETTSSVHMANAQLRERASELSRFQARASAAATKLSRLREGATWLSKQELDTAVAESNVAEAELQAARANMGVSRIALKQQRMRATRQTLTAPFAGTVIALGVDSGDSVSSGQVVMRILSGDRQVRFAFPPGELLLPKAGTSAPRVALRLQGNAQTVMTQVDAVRPEVDPSAELVFATAPLPAALPDASRWIPGAPVSVTLADQ
ncbi:MAG TPA: efflux RND transporter periplasmic adaptor subunit [Polyangiales bacterium]|nr:efflux RND transporter periplasmic adaptor subunit [Polyangiales bacterium]